VTALGSTQYHFYNLLVTSYILYNCLCHIATLHHILFVLLMKLDVPARTQRMASTAEQYNTQAKALEEIEKLLKLKKTEFLGGPHGLQAKRV